MKEKFTEPVMDIVTFDLEDVIRTSGGGTWICSPNTCPTDNKCPSNDQCSANNG